MAKKHCRECKGGGFGYNHNVLVRCLYHPEYDGKSKVRRNCGGCHFIYKLRHPVCPECWGSGRNQNGE